MMKRDNHTTTQPPTQGSDAAPEAHGWLPGLAACTSRGGGLPAPQGAGAGPHRAAAWSVRSSDKQVSDKHGQPAGFRHQLLWGKMIIKSGIGADWHRTFSTQAAFLNERGAKPDSKTSTIKGTATKAGPANLSQPNVSAEI